MKKNSSTIVFGLDLGDRRHAVRVLGEDGRISRERIIANSRKAPDKLSDVWPGALIAMEVGMH